MRWMAMWLAGAALALGAAAPATGAEKAVAADGVGKRQPVAQAAVIQVGFELPPGRYVADPKWSTGRQQYALEVEEGVPAEHLVDLNAGVVELSAVSESGMPLRGDLTWTIWHMRVWHSGPAGKGKQAAFKSGTRPSFVLPAGSYLLELGYQNKTFSTDFEIGAGESKQITVTVPSF